MSKITWTTERRKVSDLIAWPRNPRQIKGEQVRRLQESVEEFGQFDTIAIGPGNEVYNGHQRLKSWGAKYGADFEVEVRVSSRALTEKEREKLTILAHKGAAGEFDFDVLANEFEIDELIEWGFSEKELQLGGFDLNEPKGEDAGAQVDKAEELRVKWGVESGQLWKLGEHRLICGDCTKAEDVDRLMQGEKAGAVVTDPPYGINREGIEHDDPEGLPALFDGCLEVMPVDNAVIIAFQSPRLFPEWLDAIRAHGQKFERMLWMYKSNDVTFTWRGWLTKSEAILVSSVGKPDWKTPNEYKHDCYSINWDKSTMVDVEGWHASIKPPLIVENLIDNTTGIVYEPFSGSGTTLIACERLSRKCRAVEISPAYVAVAIQRWVDMTGGTPELISQ